MSVLGGMQGEIVFSRELEAACVRKKSDAASHEDAKSAPHGSGLNIVEERRNVKEERFSRRSMESLRSTRATEHLVRAQGRAHLERVLKRAAPCFVGHTSLGRRPDGR